MKVLDFGLTKPISDEAAIALTQTGLPFGTPRFLASETVYGNDAVPLEESWDREKARQWWKLHGIVGEGAHDQECFFPEPELSAGAVQVATTGSSPGDP